LRGIVLNSALEGSADVGGYEKLERRRRCRRPEEKVARSYLQANYEELERSAEKFQRYTHGMLPLTTGRKKMLIILLTTRKTSSQEK